MTQAAMPALRGGVSGNKVRDLKARWQNDTLALQPTLLSVLIGVNDALAMVPLETFERDYDGLLAATKAAVPSVRLVLGEPFSLPVGPKEQDWDAWSADIKARQAIVSRLAVRYGAPVVYFQSVFDQAMQRAPADYWIWDGIHPTYAGHQVMADEWERTVNQFWSAT
jgi:lysophospholipase L1-like esterase